jgi:hypothetical protein
VYRRHGEEALSEKDNVIDFAKARQRRNAASKPSPDPAPAIPSDGSTPAAGLRFVLDVGVIPTEHGMVPWYLNGKELEVTIENARKLATKFNLGARYVERELWKRNGLCSWCGGDPKACPCAKKRSQKPWGWSARHWLDSSKHAPMCETKGRRPVYAKKKEEVTCKRCLARMKESD